MDGPAISILVNSVSGFCHIPVRALSLWMTGGRNWSLSQRAFWTNFRYVMTMQEILVRLSAASMISL